jgi:hypothetical protein
MVVRAVSSWLFAWISASRSRPVSAESSPACGSAARRAAPHRAEPAGAPTSLLHVLAELRAQALALAAQLFQLREQLADVERPRRAAAKAPQRLLLLRGRRHRAPAGASRAQRPPATLRASSLILSSRPRTKSRSDLTKPSCAAAG